METNGNGWKFGDPPPDPLTARGTKVTLADGHQWRLPPLNFFERQEHDGVLTSALKNVDWTNPAAQQALVDLLKIPLGRNYPTIPMSELPKLLDVEAACECFKVVWVQEGVSVRELLSHLGLAPPSKSTPTGPASTDG